MDELEIEEFEDDFEIDDSFEQLPKPTSATLAEDPDAGLVEKKSSHSHSDDHLTFADFADSSGSGARGGGMLAGGSSKGSSGAAGGGAGPGLFIDNPFTFNDDDTTNKMRSVGKVETPHFSPIESPSEGHAAPEPQGNTNSRTSNQSANAQNAAMSMPDFLKGLSDDEVDSEEEGAALFGIGIGTAGAAAATTKKDVRPEVAGGGSPTSPAQPPRASAAVGDSFMGDVEIGGEQEQVEDFSSAAPSGGPPHPAPGVKSSGLLQNDIDVDALLKSSSSQDEGSLFAHLHKQEKVSDRAEPAAPVNSNEFETASGASSSGTGTTGGRGRRPRGASIGEKEDGAVDPLDAALFGAAAGAATASGTTGSGTAPAGAGAATDEIEGHDHQNSHHPNSSSANKRKSTAGGPLLARSPTSRDMQAASNTMDSHSDDSDAELFKGVAVSNKKKPPVARAQTQRQMSSQGPGSDDLSERSGSGAAGTGSERNAGPVTIGSVDDADLFTLGPAGPPAAGTAASSGATSGGTAGGQGGPPTPPIMKLSKNEETTAAPALTTAAPVIGSVNDVDLFTLGPGPSVGGATAASVEAGGAVEAAPPEATPGAGAVGEEIDFTSLLKQKPKRKFQAAAPAAVEEPARGPRAQPSSTTSSSTLGAGVAVVAGGVAAGEAAAAAGGASGASTASSGASPADQQKGPAASAPRPGSSSPGGRQFVEKIGGGVNYMQPYNPEMGNANKPRVHGPGMPPPLVSETTTTSSEAYTIQDEERPAATDESAPPAIGALPKHGEDVIREEIEGSGETKTGTYGAGRARGGSKGSSSRAKLEKEIEQNAARGASTGGGAAARAVPSARRTTSKDRQGAVVPEVAAGSGTAGGAAGRKKAGILKRDNAAGGRLAPAVQAQSAGGAARPREQTDAKKIEARLSTPPADEGGGGASASGASLASMGYSEDFEVYSDDFEQEQFAVAVAGKPKERTPAPGAATAKGRSSTVGVPGGGQQQRSSNDARTNSRTVSVVSSRVPGHSRKGILNIAGEKGLLTPAPPQPHVKRTRPRVRNNGGGTEQPGVILTAENARNVLRVRGRKTAQRGTKNEGRPTSSSSTNDDDGASIESVSKESTAAPSRQKSPVDPNKKSPTDTGINVDNVDPAWLPPQYRDVAVKVMAVYKEEGYQSSPPRSPSPPAARPGTSSVRNRNRLKAAAGGTHDEQVILGEQQAEVGGAGSASPGKSKPAPPVGGGSSAAATSRKKRSTGPAPAGAAASSSSGGGDPHHRQRGEEDGASDAEDFSAEQLNSVSLGGAPQGTSSKGEAYASDYRPPGSALTSNRSPTRQGTRGGGSNRQVPDFIRVQKRIDKARKEHVLAELQQMLNETWRHDKNLKMRALKNEWTQQRLEQQKHQEELRMQRIREIEAERNNYVEKQLRDRQNYLRRKEEDRKRKELEQKRFSLLQRVYDEGLRKEKLKELEKEREKHREKFKKKIKFVMPQWID
mmetsp:Transcript_23210/g.58636  ORF Transcript_23210/g.58636 Transcript_23210/m.58636 type:complete len:1475 (+) Transcript_23210:144-4568(+)|eukprot:CAMPEP_0178997182 /NCGR_PEP_ID=MMETSP0795-20121207/8785_1 /TAXON_ID=88552 /ORGANISM="Amoebophrya sp., Strain Ameob2" /LENGTH=1474 /DNA_ID=CAMNT_0020689661 /DNA_START=99 /DNA_END=4523 /DNA_ORIENTATION=-